MSQLYEALRRLERENREPGAPPAEPLEAIGALNVGAVDVSELENVHEVSIALGDASRLVVLAEPQSLGAEKFRVLAARLENIRRQRRTLKSFQVTSSIVSEGKTFIAGNLAATLAKCVGFRTLLIEGDLHRPSLASLFGLGELPGIGDWFTDPQGAELKSVLHRMTEMPLWLLTAGKRHHQPSEILQSSRLAEAFAGLAKSFDWIVVDSTPMQPIVDANLWSRLVDGTLLVVREGVAPVKALTRGLQALDDPKLLGIVINDASHVDHVSYKNRYYAANA